MDKTYYLYRTIAIQLNNDAFCHLKHKVLNESIIEDLVFLKPNKISAFQKKIF